MFETVIDIMQRFIDSVTSLDIRISPIYLVMMLVIASVIYFRRKSTEPFFAWLFPARIYFHKSHMVDIKLFVLGRFLSIFGMINGFVSSVAVSAFIIGMIGSSAPESSIWSPVLMTFIVVIANDFGVYWVHRIHHTYAPLWPFHSVHHSAEVMTPITVYRKHPVYDLISGTVRGIVLGVVQGVLLAFFVGKVEITALAGANAIYVVFNFLGSNFRHTHIWFSYGPVLERILISPAQHQVHHSVEVRHHNKNYGEILAVWDWIFGSLYVPQGREELQFGLADENGVPIEQPHSSLTRALVVPFYDFVQAFVGPRESDKTVSE